jgi:hypothetical protein
MSSKAPAANPPAEPQAKTPAKTPGEGSEAGKAEHGAPSEVSWETGKGHQPYANQGASEGGEPKGGDEFAEGDRGELSGRNLEQLEQVKKKP